MSTNEIERKFVLPLTTPWRHRSADAAFMVRQAYIGEPDSEMEVRVREKTPIHDEETLPQYTLTTKVGKKLERAEDTRPVDPAVFKVVFEKSDLTVQKKRFEHKLTGDLTLELDIFRRPISDLILGEVEFKTRDQAHAFDPDRHDLTVSNSTIVDNEVTNDLGFKNREIAKGSQAPLADWTAENAPTP